MFLALGIGSALTSLFTRYLPEADFRIFRQALAGR